MAAAEREIETLPVEEALNLHGRDDVVFVDLRDIRELQRDGRIPGAFHCPRGMLEFWIDPGSHYHKPVFAQDKRFVFFCAGGLRSALAAQTAQTHGAQAGRPYRRRLRGVAQGGRRGRASTEQVMAMPSVVRAPAHAGGVGQQSAYLFVIPGQRAALGAESTTPVVPYS